MPLRIASELGRAEFVMVSLVEGEDGLVAYPTVKGSGAITSFTQADGFLRIDALADHLPAGMEAEVTLFSPHLHLPDLVIIGSHCPGLDLVLEALVRAGLMARTLAVGSLGGLTAARRGECDLAPIHLLDEKTGVYNVSSSVRDWSWCPVGGACRASSIAQAMPGSKVVLWKVPLRRPFPIPTA